MAIGIAIGALVLAAAAPAFAGKFEENRDTPGQGGDGIDSFTTGPCSLDLREFGPPDRTLAKIAGRDGAGWLSPSWSTGYDHGFLARIPVRMERTAKNT